MFPGAKIINCNRNPISTILSIIKNNLTEVPWAHNVENILKYYDNYLKTNSQIEEFLKFRDF